MSDAQSPVSPGSAFPFSFASLVAAPAASASDPTPPAPESNPSPPRPVSPPVDAPADDGSPILMRVPSIPVDDDENDDGEEEEETVVVRKAARPSGAHQSPELGTQQSSELGSPAPVSAPAVAPQQSDPIDTHPQDHQSDQSASASSSVEEPLANTAGRVQSRPRPNSAAAESTESTMDGDAPLATNVKRVRKENNYREINESGVRPKAGPSAPRRKSTDADADWSPAPRKASGKRARAEGPSEHGPSPKRVSDKGKGKVKAGDDGDEDHYVEAAPDYQSRIESSSAAVKTVKKPPTAREKGKGKAVSKPDDPDPTKHHEYRLQRTTCLAHALSSFPKCHICTTRRTGTVSSCGFLNVRCISYSAGGTPIAAAFVTASSLPVPETPDFPTEFSTPFLPSHALLIKSVAATHLRETMAAEAAHAALPNAVRLSQVLGERSTCDTCLHAVLSGSWLCTTCGRELCFACLDEVKAIEAADAAVAENAFKVYSDEQKRLRKCKHRTGDHGVARFIPLTRFDAVEVAALSAEMNAWHDAHPYVKAASLPDEELVQYYARDPDAYTTDPSESHPFLHVPDLSPVVYTDDFPSAAPGPPLTEDAATDKLFHALWTRGETMVVDVARSERSFLDWNPSFFIKEYGQVPCKVASNRTGVEHNSTVGAFFEIFGQTREDPDILKIKDWPSAADFKDAFPSLFEDYMRALPVGQVTRRDGVLNIAAHTPTNANPPDLGPKGYFSQVSDDKEGGQGSTKLHNAVNLMLWAGPAPDGGPGRAAWDLFRAEDSEGIRDFIYQVIGERKKPKQTGEQLRKTLDDPIHGQNIYLDETLRARLLEEKGIKSWRIWQVPGQVVFIPAGCAHQVCNFADCIKIASDFVSMENVGRCWQVTKEFRKQTKEGAPWRSDVLQLKSQLLWAWKSCERFDAPRLAPTLSSVVPMDIDE